MRGKKFARYRWLLATPSRARRFPKFSIELGRKLAEHLEISPISTALLKEIYPFPRASGMHNMRDKNDVRINIDGWMRVEWSSPILPLPLPSLAEIEQNFASSCWLAGEGRSYPPGFVLLLGGKIEILAGIIDVLRRGRWEYAGKEEKLRIANAVRDACIAHSNEN